MLRMRSGRPREAQDGPRRSAAPPPRGPPRCGPAPGSHSHGLPSPAGRSQGCWRRGRSGRVPAAGDAGSRWQVLAPLPARSRVDHPAGGGGRGVPPKWGSPGMAAGDDLGPILGRVCRAARNNKTPLSGRFPFWLYGKKYPCANPAPASPRDRACPGPVPARRAQNE